MPWKRSWRIWSNFTITLGRGRPSGSGDQEDTLEIYPYLPGGFGTSIGSALDGKATLARTPDHKLEWAFLRPAACEILRRYWQGDQHDTAK